MLQTHTHTHTHTQLVLDNWGFLHNNALKDRHAFVMYSGMDAAEQHEELTLYNEAFLCCVWQRGSA